jgi:hypothetical protein
MARFLTRYGNALFLGFLGVGVALLVAIESIFNGGFVYSIKATWFPLALLTFGVTWMYRHDFKRIGRSRSKVWITAALLYPIALLMTWPYVMAANALTTSGRSITYQGPVTHKWISSGRFPGNQVVIFDQATGKKITLSMSQSRYNTLSKGDNVMETFSIGGLGIPFRWRQER